VLLLGGVCLVQIANLAAIPFATGSGIAVCLYGPAVGITGAVLSLMLVPIQLTVPDRTRGQTMSIADCGVTLLGAGLGPFLVGLSDFLAAAPRLGCAWPLSALPPRPLQPFCCKILLCFHAPKHCGQAHRDHCFRRATGLIDGSDRSLGFS